jgi:hypothetical protein
MLVGLFIWTLDAMVLLQELRSVESKGRGVALTFRLTPVCPL